ncbi:MAG: nucleotidyltransferase family protein [Methanothrix sp.]
MKRKNPMAVSKPLKSMPKPALEDLMQLLRDNLADLRREYRIGSLWLFGSYVRGEQHKRSDLDILVEFEEVPTLPKFISLERKLRDITGIKVDLVSIRALKGEIGERILLEKVAL